MLKGKKSLYILLPLNVFIWSYMGYKIYSAFNEGDDSDSQQTVIAPPKLKADDSTAYVLRLNYKDPFLKEEPRTRNAALALQVARPSAPTLPKAAAPEKKPTDIKYLGLIENKTSGSTAAMVSVNGSSQIIKPGQAIGDMVFQSITRDFIVVKIGKEKLTITK